MLAPVGDIIWDLAPAPPQLRHQAVYYPSTPVPVWNRGAMCQTGNGTLSWAVACAPSDSRDTTCVELLASPDRGVTWDHLSTVARDPAVVFGETSSIETPRADLVVAHSRDHGRTCEPWQDVGIGAPPYHIPVVYYSCVANGTRHIAGTFLDTVPSGRPS